MENRDPEILNRLDQIISILKIAHRSALDAVASDDVAAAVLAAAKGRFVASGALKASVAKKTKQSEKTVQRRIAELLALGCLEANPGHRAAYRSTGVA